jgi:hypothetical protein
MHEQAITALREALEQPEQEPTCPKCKAAVLYECVACSNNNYPPRPEQQAEQCVGKDPRCPCQDGDACHYKDCGDTKALPVPVAQPAQEPVAWAVQACSKMWRGEFAEIDAKAEAKRIGGTCVAYPLYTAAAQRPWQGLKAEEILDLFDRNNVYGSKWIEFARTVEAALRSKNK